MKFYWIILLLLGGLLSHCTTEGHKNQKTSSEKVAPCNSTLIKAMQGKLTTTNVQELTDFLRAYTPACSIQEEPLLHAILIQAFDKRLPTLLEILAANKELELAYLLELISLPATQLLPQRSILLMLQGMEWKPPTTLQVEAAFQKSVEEGDAALRKLANDKRHTYQ